MTVNYLVTKETFAFRQCPDCTAGFNLRKFQGQTMKVACTACRGTGTKKITHRTEITLQEALLEINNNKTNEHK